MLPAVTRWYDNMTYSNFTYFNTTHNKHEIYHSRKSSTPKETRLLLLWKSNYGISGLVVDHSWQLDCVEVSENGYGLYLRHGVVRGAESHDPSLRTPGGPRLWTRWPEQGPGTASEQNPAGSTSAPYHLQTPYSCYASPGTSLNSLHSLQCSVLQFVGNKSESVDAGLSQLWIYDKHLTNSTNVSSQSFSRMCGAQDAAGWVCCTLYKDLKQRLSTRNSEIVIY